MRRIRLRLRGRDFWRGGLLKGRWRLSCAIHSRRAGGAAATEVFTITLQGRRPGAYVARAETITIQARALTSPAPLDLVLDSLSERTRGGAVVANFAEVSPEYAGANFETETRSGELTISAEGVVGVADGEELLSGETYSLAALARGTEANPFFGAARFELGVDVLFSAAEVAPYLPERSARVYAAEGYRDSVYTLTLSGADADVNARFVSSSPGFAVSEGVVSLTRALPAGGLAGGFDVWLSRGEGDSRFSGAVVSVSVAAVSAAQEVLLATIAEDGAVSGLPHGIVYPAGFAADGFRAELLGVGGGELNHFAVAGGALVEWTTQLTAGAYDVTLGISHAGFLGTLTAVVQARVGGFGDIADADEIPTGARTAAVLVAPDYAGELRRVAAAAATVELLIPDDVADGFALTRGAAENEAVFYLLSALGSAGEAAVAATITQRSGGVFENATIAVSVSALAAPEVLRVGLAQSIFATLIADDVSAITLALDGLNAADLNFERHSADGDYFTVFAAGEAKAGEVGVTLTPPFGIHGLTVAAWSALSPPAFLGTLYYPVLLEVRTASPPPLEVARAFPRDGTTLTSRAAAGYVGPLLTLTSAQGDVVLRFAESGRAAFDSREDFGYDYAANVLSLKRALEVGGRAAASLTLTAERIGYAAELTVSVVAAAVAVDPVAAEINAAAGFTGALYDFGAGDLAGAAFRQVSASSPALTLSADGVVSVASALGEVGARHTLVGAARAGAEPLSFFHGAAEVSLEVEVVNYPQKRGLYYQEYNGECSDLGTGWRLPGLLEAGGLIVGEVGGLSSINFSFLFRESDIIPGYAGGFHELGRDDPAIVADGVWLETSMTGREDEESFPAALGWGWAQGAATRFWLMFCRATTWGRRFGIACPRRSGGLRSRFRTRRFRALQTRMKRAAMSRRCLPGFRRGMF